MSLLLNIPGSIGEKNWEFLLCRNSQTHFPIIQIQQNKAYKYNLTPHAQSLASCSETQTSCQNTVSTEGIPIR